MEADIWQAGMEALVSVPEQALAGPPAPEEWRADAHLYRDESALAATPEEAAALLVAACRAAEAAGDAVAAARGYDEALAGAPHAAEALRARARLAEGLGELDEAHALWTRLAAAAGSAEERAFYGGLSAEWTLARRGTLPAVAVDAIPPGPARAIALAEAALREGAGAAAGALGAAGRALGPSREQPAGPPVGPAAIGAAFIEQAARVALTARDANAAAAYLAAARRLAPAEPGIPLAALGGAARATGRDAEKKLAEVLPGLPAGSPVTEAVRRWGAGLAPRARRSSGCARIPRRPAGRAGGCPGLHRAGRRAGRATDAGGAGAGPQRRRLTGCRGDADLGRGAIVATPRRPPGHVRAAGRRRRGGARRDAAGVARRSESADAADSAGGALALETWLRR